MGEGAPTTDRCGGRTLVLGCLWLGWVLLPSGFLLWGGLMTWGHYGQPVPPELEQEASAGSWRASAWRSARRCSGSA